MKKPVPPQPLKRSPARERAKAIRGSSTKSPWASDRPFPIVGIGASAGGLEALLQFFTHLPSDSGMAFAVVQHLDPIHKGMLPELLQRATAMRVIQVKDRTRIRPNHVYVIPPNRDMSLLHGVLHLLAPTTPRGLRLPIDFFFRSLAEDQHERSVGIILSGMGSDGTMGLRAIKQNAGLGLVQEPATAKFDTMPRSAIDAGLADFVASAEELPHRLVAYQRRLPRLSQTVPPMGDRTRSSLEKIVILLRHRTHHDFTLYRRSTLSRRVERRMGIHQLGKLSAYVRYLQQNPQELDILFKELLIGVTGFFRDPGAWHKLATPALRRLLADGPAGRTLRAWVAGCSTGEEAYSLAILFTEVQRQMKSVGNYSLQIYATDLDKDAIDKARQGFFPENIAAEVSPARLNRFFVKEPNGYRVKKEIRAMVVFAAQNLIMDPPFTKLDILCCRNLLIYLTPALQKKLFPLFHYSLNPRGVLFLGSAESIGTFTRLFTPIAVKERIFRRNETGTSGHQLDFPAVYRPAPADQPDVPAGVPAASSPNLPSLVDQLLRARFAPPAVLVNEHGDILYISGRTGQYLEPAAGKANWNVIAMAREGLRYDLATALRKVRREKGLVTVRGVKVGHEPGAPLADLTVQALTEPKTLVGMVLIVFSPAVVSVETSSRRGEPLRSVQGVRQRELERELLQARREVHAAREEMQSSQEELKSMNEELQSSNEEMQSTNEELMTSKEEMQSLNEELQTVNAELQSKLDELSATNNDMKNLLNSTEIATVFLDNDLRLRRFTHPAKTIIKLIASDVGRPITDLASDLIYPELVSDAREVLRTLVYSERSIPTRDERWFTVRVMPYRTTDNRIEGLVITFSDITAAKKLEAALREANRGLVAKSTKQGVALTRAEERWATSGATRSSRQPGSLAIRQPRDAGRKEKP